MKHLKVSISAMALILGMSAAFATAGHRNLDDKKWGVNRSTGMYEDITGQSEDTEYECNSDEGICTETFPSDVNPNDQANDQHPGVALPTSRVSGEFVN